MPQPAGIQTLKWLHILTYQQYEINLSPSQYSSLCILSSYYVISLDQHERTQHVICVCKNCYGKTNVNHFYHIRHTSLMIINLHRQIACQDVCCMDTNVSISFLSSLLVFMLFLFFVLAFFLSYFPPVFFSLLLFLFGSYSASCLETGVFCLYVNFDILYTAGNKPWQSSIFPVIDKSSSAILL